ncbi:MAG TPA: hypothetical protein VFU35_10910 [Jatrophihabitans sp.]|nr:hypothetical protein [Jatrophihabitans sp.]
MQATRGAGYPASRARALAAILVCALGLTLATTAATATHHRQHAGHQVAIVAKTGDLQYAAPRGPDTHGVLVATAVQLPTGPRVGSSDVAATAKSRIAVTSFARGPPAQALA